MMRDPYLIAVEIIQSRQRCEDLRVSFHVARVAADNAIGQGDAWREAHDMLDTMRSSLFQERKRFDELVGELRDLKR